MSQVVSDLLQENAVLKMKLQEAEAKLKANKEATCERIKVICQLNHDLCQAESNILDLEITLESMQDLVHVQDDLIDSMKASRDIQAEHITNLLDEVENFTHLAEVMQVEIKSLKEQNGKLQRMYEFTKHHLVEVYTDHDFLVEAFARIPKLLRWIYCRDAQEALDEVLSDYAG